MLWHVYLGFYLFIEGIHDLTYGTSYTSYQVSNLFELKILIKLSIVFIDSTLKYFCKDLKKKKPGS